MWKMFSWKHPNAKNQLLVTLIRHGETTLNAQRLMQGQTDIPLSDIGREQAKLFGQKNSNLKYTRVYSSDLARAHETAQLILQHSNHRNMEIKLDKRLRERCFGEFEGRHATELLNEASKEGLNIIDFTPNGGESSKEVSIRAGNFFNELCDLTDSLESLDSEHVLVASHGGWMSNLMRHLNSNRESFSLKNFEEAQCYKIPPNTGITRFAITSVKKGESRRRTIIFDCMNDASHLDVLKPE